MLLSVSNAKTLKSIQSGYLTAIMHLAPARLSGYNVCPAASLGCEAACLHTAGHGGIIPIGESTNQVQTARIARTKFFFEDRERFISQLINEIANFVRYAGRNGLTPAVRLNGLSDIRWENYGVIEQFPHVQFYDYTKISNRRNLPENYHLTFSRSENNESEINTAFQNGMNVAVVFRKGGPRIRRIYTLEERLRNREKRELAKLRRIGRSTPPRQRVPRPVDMSWIPSTFYGRPVINGDETDLRFLDERGVVVALTAKGLAKYDTSGFIVDVS
jgi:hypothetical protein